MFDSAEWNLSVSEAESEDSVKEVCRKKPKCDDKNVKYISILRRNTQVLAKLDIVVIGEEEEEDQRTAASSVHRREQKGSTKTVPEVVTLDDSEEDRDEASDAGMDSDEEEYVSRN